MKFFILDHFFVSYFRRLWVYYSIGNALKHYGNKWQGHDILTLCNSYLHSKQASTWSIMNMLFGSCGLFDQTKQNATFWLFVLILTQIITVVNKDYINIYYELPNISNDLTEYRHPMIKVPVCRFQQQHLSTMGTPIVTTTRTRLTAVWFLRFSTLPCYARTYVRRTTPYHKCTNTGHDFAR
jgi:hypothetical protein